MARLVNASTDSMGQFVGVDEDGHVWLGEMKRDRGGWEYISWRRPPSEFQDR
jgi:hypothetical protein